MNVNQLLKKRAYYVTFYKSSLRQSVSVTLAAIVIISKDGWNSQNAITAWIYLFPTLGLLVDALYKLTIRKNESYFYHNASCSIFELYLVSFIFSSLLSIILYIIVRWIFV